MSDEIGSTGENQGDNDEKVIIIDDETKDVEENPVIPDDLQNETMEGISEDLQKGTMEEIPEDLQNEIIAEIPEDSQKDAMMEEIPEDFQTETIQQIDQDLRKGAMEEISEDLQGEAMEEIPEDLQNEIIAEIPEDLQKETIEEILEDLQKDGMEEIPEDSQKATMEETSEGMQKETTEEVPEEMKTDAEPEKSQIDFRMKSVSFLDQPTLSLISEEMQANIGKDIGVSVPEEPKEANAEQEEEEVFASHIPFHLKWSFGTDIITPIFNLTDGKRTQFFVTASQAGIIYDYVSKEMILLQGHKNIIIDINCDDTGTWLVSVDNKDDGTIIVWDARTFLPIRTIYDSHPEGGIARVAMSGNAKYLLVIGVNFQISLWLWTLGRDQPEDVYQADPAYGKPKKICFNPQVQEHIMVAFQRQILFFLWDEISDKLILLATPTIRHKKLAGLNTDATYVGDCHECVACTNTGCAVIYGSTVYVQPLHEGPIDNSKIFVKVLKLNINAFTCIQYVDNMIATGDDKGVIMFFDKQMRILYWMDFQLPAIINLSFHLTPRNYKIVDVREMTGKLEDLFDNDDYEDRTKSEILYSQTVPRDASLQQKPIVVRDFLVCTHTVKAKSGSNGIVSLVNFLTKSLEHLLSPVTHSAVSLTAHDECPHLVIAYENGRVCMFNYETHQLLADQLLPEQKEEDENKVRATYVKYSPQGIFLAIAQSNGNIWMLDPILLERKSEEPLQFSRHKILKMCFSNDLQYFAYYDVCSTVGVFYFELENNNWRFLGKIRGHYKPINDIMFSPYFPSRLFTIGEDRYLVEYKLDPQSTELTLIQRERIEQTAIPKCFIFYPEVEGVEYRYILLADDKFKFKWISDLNLMCRSTILGPSHGCYASSPIQKISILPQSEDEYMIFANDTYIGIQKLPADGSPYKYVGTVGHPQKVLNFELSYDGKYIFTNGFHDTCVLMWEINLNAVEQLSLMAGKEFEPFYPLLEGGLHGWLFKEMQDLFYYMQIVHQGENTVLPRIVRDVIPISLLPDMVRACGFYPTEYELENLMVDIKFRDYDITGDVRTNISFYDFVTLFLNHRPVHGTTPDELEEIFDTICALTKQSAGAIDRQELISLLMRRGEQMTSKEAFKCLFSLMHQDENVVVQETKNFHFLPQTITFSTLVEELLGLELPERE